MVSKERATTRAAKETSKNPEPGDDGSASPVNGPQKDEGFSRFAIRKIFFDKPKTAPLAPSNEKQAAKPVPPPLVVPHNDDSSITKLDLIKKELVNKLNRGDYLIRNNKFTTQIKATNEAARETIKVLLSKNKLGFYSYSKDGPKLKKFVLYGLNTETTTDIMSDLQEYGLHPIEIKAMHIRNPRYHDHNNYLVYFDKEDNISLDMVRQAKYICNTKVSWNHYRSPPEKCIQCQKCFRYNHVADNCNMPLACYLCAENHTAEKCPLAKQKKEMQADKIPEEHLKCVNCRGRHTAVFKNCPARVEFINRKPVPAHQTYPKVKFTQAEPPKHNAWTGRSQLTPAHSTQASTTPQHTTPVMNRNEKLQTCHSPKLRSKRDNIYYNNNNNNTNIIAQESVQNSNKASHEHFNADQFHYTSRPEEALFTPQQLMEIFCEMMGIMRGCRSRQDQLSALAGLTVKYLSCQG